MTTQLATAQTARIRALIVVGVALVTAGLYSIVTLLYSVFARYMYVEDLDLGLDENTVFVLTRITPTDRGILILGGILALLGVAALITAAIRGRYAAARASSRHKSEGPLIQTYSLRHLTALINARKELCDVNTSPVHQGHRGHDRRIRGRRGTRHRRSCPRYRGSAPTRR